MNGLRICKQFDFFYALQYDMITVHHLNNSRSQRVLWLLEELGVPYEVKRYERDPKTMLAPPALLGVHPLGKSPSSRSSGHGGGIGGDLRVSGGHLRSRSLESGQGYAGLAAGRPKLVDFSSRIHGRSAYRRALERGGPYSF